MLERRWDLVFREDSSDGWKENADRISPRYTAMARQATFLPEAWRAESSDDLQGPAPSGTRPGAYVPELSRHCDGKLSALIQYACGTVAPAVTSLSVSFSRQTGEEPLLTSEK